MSAEQIAKWRTAYQSIEVTDDALMTIDEFVSFSAPDFIRYLEDRNEKPEIIEFIKALLRETQWAYDNWAKAQANGKPKHLLHDLIVNAGGPGQYEFTRRFISDYAKANNISL